MECCGRVPVVWGADALPLSMRIALLLTLCCALVWAQTQCSDFGDPPCEVCVMRDGSWDSNSTWDPIGNPASRDFACVHWSRSFTATCDSGVCRIGFIRCGVDLNDQMRAPTTAAGFIVTNGASLELVEDGTTSILYGSTCSLQVDVGSRIRGAGSSPQELRLEQGGQLHLIGGITDDLRIRLYDDAVLNVTAATTMSRTRITASGSSAAQRPTIVIDAPLDQEDDTGATAVLTNAEVVHLSGEWCYRRNDVAVDGDSMWIGSGTASWVACNGNAELSLFSPASMVLSDSYLIDSPFTCTGTVDVVAGSPTITELILQGSAVVSVAAGASLNVQTSMAASHAGTSFRLAGNATLIVTDSVLDVPVDVACVPEQGQVCRVELTATTSAVSLAGADIALAGGKVVATTTNALDAGNAVVHGGSTLERSTLGTMVVTSTAFVLKQADGAPADITLRNVATLSAGSPCVVSVYVTEDGTGTLHLPDTSAELLLVQLQVHWQPSTTFSMLARRERRWRILTAASISGSISTQSNLDTDGMIDQTWYACTPRIEIIDDSEVWLVLPSLDECLPCGGVCEGADRCSVYPCNVNVCEEPEELVCSEMPDDSALPGSRMCLSVQPSWPTSFQMTLAAPLLDRQRLPFSS